MTGADEPVTPAIRIAGPASAEDVAAIVAVLAAAGGGGDPEPPSAASTWADHRAAHRRPVGHGPGAWQSTFRR
ncbi:acyl-CoA carboxylase subunit epsilon [Phycicoccus sp. HDW14]|uniref:acyl-CoA carboxylase epsilon subunit n=1 Tax=Phycicoccus sp. HDW14 TaxID=2714941 RepID=UPI0014076FB6|nr:acyl-CoA carboxylase epsilon subunit [Phycicoccus sp. HDW14]QIM21495.1 acyl-CoA carboxylase subunit epsilon [Phycicoccus sp. HDW14]